MQLLGGLIYLLMGADLLIRGAVGLANRWGVPQVVVALTVVALGTSLPELTVAVQAIRDGVPGLLLGNVVGSNIANVLLVGGITAALSPIKLRAPDIRRDTVVMVIASIALFVFAAGGFSRIDGFGLLLGLVCVVGFAARDSAKAQSGPKSGMPVEWVLGLPNRMGMILFFLAAGLISLPLGATLVVESSVEIAGWLGVSNTVVGLTLVALGTSLPELATTVVAARKGRSDMALGTIVGSNMINILAIMGIAATVSPTTLPVSGQTMALDIPLMLGSALVLLWFIWNRRPIGRATGIAFTIIYVMYLAFLYT